MCAILISIRPVSLVAYAIIVCLTACTIGDVCIVDRITFSSLAIVTGTSCIHRITTCLFDSRRIVHSILLIASSANSARHSLNVPRGTWLHAHVHHIDCSRERPVHVKECRKLHSDDIHIAGVIRNVLCALLSTSFTIRVDWTARQEATGLNQILVESCEVAGVSDEVINVGQILVQARDVANAREEAGYYDKV